MIVKCENAMSAAKYVLTQLDCRIYKQEDVIYYEYDDKWITNKHDVKNHICRYIMMLNIRKMNGNPYSSNIVGCKSIYSALRKILSY